MKANLFNILFTIFLFGTTNVRAQTDTAQFNAIHSGIVKLVHSPNPVFEPATIQKPMSAKEISDLGFEQVYQNKPRKFLMRDGKHLAAYQYEKESNTTIILLHGVLSSAYLMNKTAGLLREATQSEVIALDTRGHGQSDGTPGDVDYINQYADDLEDVISAIKNEKPNQKIILAGHSMGGGIILCYAMKRKVPGVDGYLLFAPHLGENAPTIKTENAGDEPFVKIHINRMIGLKMLNGIGDTKYNNLPVLFFNLPANMPITEYSYRANMSMYPQDYREGLEAINKPLLVIVGSDDEVFDASKYAPAIRQFTTGELYIVENETHNGIRQNKKAMDKISQWAAGYRL